MFPAAVATVADAPPGDHQGDGAGVLRGFIAANYARLHRRLQRYLGCPDRASDCLHDAWLRLGETRLPASVQSPEAYVYRVARNLAMDGLRSSRLRQYVGEAEREWAYVADPGPGPDRVAEARSDVAAVERAMQGLPRRHRAVLVALRIDEQTRHEVAAHHGISLRGVDTVLRQALDHCAEQAGHPAREPRC